MSAIHIEKLPALRRALLEWFRAHRRMLPWRERRSIYATVVSEFMLQQTQVKTVLPHFERWMARFPDFSALAAAPEADVLTAWEGLGYYGRARNLHRLAKEVAAATPPHTATGWQELPGVGPYTAAAIASIACGDRIACVDGNVARVLARLTADHTDFASGTALVRHFQQLANAVLAPEHPGEWNEAMMELGALVCTPRMPACLTCPLASHCACANPFKASPLPRIARPVTEHRSVVRLWVRRGGRLLLHKGAPTARRLADLHELPSACELGLADEAARSGTLMLQRTRSITRYRIVETIHALAPDHPAADAAPVGGGTLHWFTTEELEQVALSGPHRRWVRELLARGN